MVKKIKEREDIIEERKRIEQPGPQDQEKQTDALRTVSTTPSSWWEERKGIERPGPEDQEKRYREEQEKYGLQRKRAEYLKSIQETARPGQEHKERYESEKQMRVEGEEKKDISQIMSETYKETFEKLLVSAEETKKIYSSWIAELEENSRATREVLQGEPDPAKYTEAYDMWIKSYGKMLNMLYTLPLRQNMKEIFENITGTPDIYSEAFDQITKIWTDSYAKLYVPYIDSINKEFCNLWEKMYGKTFDNFFKNIPAFSPFKEIMEPVKNVAKMYTDTFTSMSNIWVKSYNTSKEAV